MSTHIVDAFRHIRRLQIRTIRRVEDLFAGAYHSAFKGKGLEFEEVREYHPGDDVRQIDWNVTARLQTPFVKTFQEERELTVLLVVDISASTRFGSSSRLKKEIMAEIGAILAFSAIKNQDKVGLILFTNQIELFLRPKKGTRHVLRVIRELLFFPPKQRGTDLQQVLSFLGKVQRKRAICFLISDFLTTDFAHEAALIAKRHDLIAIGLNDPYEQTFPNMGLLHLADLESGDMQLIDTSYSELQHQFQTHAQERQIALKQLMSRIGANLIQLDTEKPYMDALHTFFKLREKQK
jgi:uncharacterized protein (DUF58 family)